MLLLGSHVLRWASAPCIPMPPRHSERPQLPAAAWLWRHRPCGLRPRRELGPRFLEPLLRRRRIRFSTPRPTIAMPRCLTFDTFKAEPSLIAGHVARFRRPRFKVILGDQLPRPRSSL